MARVSIFTDYLKLTKKYTNSAKPLSPVYIKQSIDIIISKTRAEELEFILTDP